MAFHVRAAEPLHVRIDTLIEAKAKDQKQALSVVADDAEFLRRLSLDFTGRIPTAEGTRKFLDDKSPNKRASQIDAFLESPEYPLAMADRLDTMLMERLGSNVTWTKYLSDSLAAKKPWDRMVREMLRADHKDEPNRSASYFLSKRLENYGQNPVDYSALTRDVGRLFMGKNFQCCECHDHLTVSDYKQQDFQGLQAYFKNSYLVNAATMQVAEKPTTEKTRFASVFTNVEMFTAPALPGGGMMLMIPMFAKGAEYLEKPDPKTKNPGMPKFSTLAAAAEQIPTAKNRDFVRNSVNRIWFLMLGRGLVHPLDMGHAENPPSHPELLELLADEFVAHQFDLKFLFREIAMTSAYQRSSLLPVNSPVVPPQAFTTAIEKRLSAEQLFASMAVATGNTTIPATKAKFLKAFANQAREPEYDVEPSLKAALFVLHDDAVLSLLTPKAGNLVDRLMKIDDTGKFADELYLSVLSRKPLPAEAKIVTDVLTRHNGKREVASRKLAWALLTSMEFGVNH